MNFKFEKIYVSEKNIDVNTIVRTIENDQCTQGYPYKLLQKEHCTRNEVFY